MIDLSVNSLREAYFANRLTPRQVIAEIRQRIGAARDYNAFIRVLAPESLEPYLDRLERHEPEALPLWGIPFAIKDNIDLADCPTTAACPAFSYVPRTSATVVERLLAAGALPVGKTNLDQFATGLVGTRSPYGEVRNAVDPDFIAGGSSSGSAVAVKLGLASIALGTDTAGSGRVPAALNGLFGFKPTRGWWSTRGVVPACRTLDCVSVFARSAGEIRLLAGLCGGYDDKDDYARHVAFRGFDVESPRLGFIAPDDCDEAEKEAYLAFVKHLDPAGIEVDYTPFAAAARLLYEGPWLAERYAALADFVEHRPQSLHPVTLEVIRQGRTPTAVDAFNAAYELARLKREVEGIFETIDALVLPTVPARYRIEDVRRDPIGTNTRLGTYTNFVNLLDLCALAMPAGDAGDGYPFGVTLVGLSGRDHALIDLGARLADEVPPAGERPGEFHLCVCGAHLSGQPLNRDLVSRGGYLVEPARTSGNYRLYALPDGKRPALVRSPGAGQPVAVEIWSLPAAAMGELLETIAPPLGIGQVELEDGRWVGSFIAEATAVTNAIDITRHGGWRQYRAGT